MAKRSRMTTSASIQKRLQQGRGQGRGIGYRPWITIQDLPSQGTCERIHSWTIGRVHHCLSQLEAAYFYVLDFSSLVVDIREQFPLLPLEETEAIAAELGVKHPTDPKSQHPAVMTTDFVITSRQGLRDHDQARTIKYTSDLLASRTLEKLEIERRYWVRRHVDWGIVTECEIPAVTVRNIKWIHPFRDVTALAPLSQTDVARVQAVLTDAIAAGSSPLAALTTACDDRLGLSAGSSLSAVRHLLAGGIWQVDLFEALDPRRPLSLLHDGAAKRCPRVGNL